MRRNKITWAALAAGILGVATGAPALADYPERPVTIVAPYGPGGSSDVLSRILAERMTDSLGGNFIVENQPGAGSRVGTEAVARAPADGYTLLLADMPFTIVPNLYEDAQYDPVEDFTPIAMIGVAPMVLFARPDFEGDDVNAAVSTAKDAPGDLTIGSGGVGATTHMMAELFQREADIELLHVPYGGAGPALQGLAGGQTDLAFSTLATGSPLLQAGSIKALGVTSDEPIEALPDVGTFDEAGYDLVVEHWWGLFAPAGTPDDVVEILREAARSALENEGVQERLRQLGVEPRAMSAEEFADFVGDENARWAEIIEAADIQPQ
jgi:tripartite-type tricarboxylate transporter receptor subunit TctC